MNKALNIYLILSFLLGFASVVFAQPHPLYHKLQKISTSKNATIGLAVWGTQPGDTLSVLGDQRFPMQSVFKFPIVLCMLAEVDKGTFTLEEPVTVAKSELLPGFWSPLRDKYPEGVTLPLSALMRYALSWSDNVACDVLLRLLGGPLVVEAYFHQKGFKDIAIKINEKTMQSDWDIQFLNWVTPREMNRILRAFYENKQGWLSPGSHAFVWDLMKGTTTGAKRLKGQLPAGTVVAHKTGWSGKNDQTGITAAVNDVGMVFLPNGDYFFISVFVTDSQEDFETNEGMIAEVAGVCYKYFEASPPAPLQRRGE